MRLIADLHLHTVVSDGALHPADVVRVSRAKSVDVISVTDHDTLLGSLLASRYVSKPQVLLYGAEVRTRLGDVLVLCPSPIKLSRDLWELVDVCRDGNCLMVPAHPYDLLRLGIGPYVRLSVWDAIEVFNASSDPLSNALTYVAVRGLGKPLIASSDAHVAELVGASYTIVYADGPSVDDVLESIRRSRTVPVMRYPARGHVSRLTWRLRRFVRRHSLGLKSGALPRLP